MLPYKLALLVVTSNAFNNLNRQLALANTYSSFFSNSHKHLSKWCQIFCWRWDYLISGRDNPGWSFGYGHVHVGTSPWICEADLVCWWCSSCKSSYWSMYLVRQVMWDWPPFGYFVNSFKTFWLLKRPICLQLVLFLKTMESISLLRADDIWVLLLALLICSIIC